VARRIKSVIILFLIKSCVSIVYGETLRVASYNLQNYTLQNRIIDGKFEPDYPKPEIEKAALRKVIIAANPDVLAVQEIGGTAYVAELQRDLLREGFDFPYEVTLLGPDKKRQIAILSKRKIKKIFREPHLPIFYKNALGVRFDSEVSRGLLGVIFETDAGEVALFTVHLKSRLTSNNLDDLNSANQRIAESTVIRNYLKKNFFTSDTSRLLVVGDFNDNANSDALKRFTEINKQNFLEMIDLRDSRGEFWTYRNVVGGYYSRSDYFLVSKELMHYVRRSGIFEDNGENLGSDHRLIWADFEFSKK